MRRLRNFHRTKAGIIFLSLLAFILILSLILFTPWGNRLITPIVEKSLSSGLSTPMSVQEFSLSHNRFHLMAQDNFGNTLSTQGGFSLLTLRMYAHYRIECFNAEGMNLIGVPFKINGAISGGIASLYIRGNGHIFEGNLHYEGELRRFQLAHTELIFDSLDYESLLHRLDYPSDTDTTLSGTIRLKGFDRRDVTGNIHMATLTKRFKPTPIKADDDNTSFDLRSLLADKFGRIKPFDLHINLDASLEHAGVLEQFVGISLGGTLNLKGSVEGDEGGLKLKATSDVAQSETKFIVLFPDLEPSSLTLDLRDADAKETFELFALPAPISGKLSAYAELNTSSGTLHAAIRNGKTEPDILKQHYQITQPLIHFSADVDADLSQKGVHYRAAFKSDLSHLEMDNTTTHDQMLRELLKTLR